MVSLHLGSEETAKNAHEMCAAQKWWGTPQQEKSQAFLAAEYPALLGSTHFMCILMGLPFPPTAHSIPCVSPKSARVLRI